MLAEKINKARAAGLNDDEIASFISEKDQDFASKLSKSREAGLGNSEVLDFIAGIKDRSSPVDPSYLAQQFAGGLGKGIQGYANTADKLGMGGDAAKAASEFGKAIAAPQKESAMERFLNPKQGDTTVLGYGVGSIPGAVAEGGAGMLADLGAMAAGGAIAGPVGANALPMASYGLREYGNELDKRIANNGGAPATGTDQAATAASILAQSALNRLALGKVGGGAAIGERTLLDGAKRVGVATGTEAATNAAQELTSQIATSAGTNKGLNLDPKELGGAAILGGATGGAFRAAGEAGTQFRNLTDAYNTRNLLFKEEAGNVASEIARISEDAKRTLGDRKADTQSLLDYEARLGVMAEAPIKRAVAELDAMLAKKQISQDEHSVAKSALTERATPEGMKVAERLIGGMGEGADAIAFTKRKAVLDQLKTEGGFSKDGVIKGGLTAKGERLLSEAKSTLTAAGLGGGLAYAGYKGLGTFGATVASLQSALPAAYALGGAYLGARALDTMLGTSSPVAQVARRFGEKGNPINSPSESLPKWAELDAAEKQRQADLKAKKDFAKLMDQRVRAQAANERINAQMDRQDTALINRTDRENAANLKEQAKQSQQVRDLMEKRRNAQTFDEQAFVDKVDENATTQLIKDTQTQMSNEQKAASIAMQLAQASQKLDLARNVVKPAEYYQGITQLRGDANEMQAMLKKVQLDLGSSKIDNTANKAAQKGKKAAPEAQTENPKTGSKKAKTTTQDTGVLSGPSQSDGTTSDTGRLKTINRRAETVFSFERHINKIAPDAADSIMSALGDLRQRVNNYGDGLKAVKQAMKQHPDQAQFISDWWMKPGAALKDTRLGKLYSFRDGNKIGVIMTKKQAEARRLGEPNA